MPLSGGIRIVRTCMRFKTYPISFLAVVLLFIAANYYSYVRIGYGSCDDCFLSFGFPFPLWEEGGFATVKRILWSGLIADLYVAASVSILSDWLLKKALSRNSKVKEFES